MMGWVVVMTFANMERKVLEACEPYALPTYLPQYLDDRGRPRIMFRNYVFVECPECYEFLLFNLKGGIKPLPAGPRAARLSQETIDQFRARESNRGYIDLDDDVELYAPRFEHGQSIQVQSGPYVNKVVIYKGMDDRGREMALFSLLGRDVVGSFKRSELTALPAVKQ